MKKRDLFRLSFGEYDLTDNIDNYYYTLRVFKCDSGNRGYKITEKGSSSITGIFMIEEIKKDDDGFKYKHLSALAGVGGLRIHSDDTYWILKELKFIPRGSFEEFVKRTSI